MRKVVLSLLALIAVAISENWMFDVGVASVYTPETDSIATEEYGDHQVVELTLNLEASAMVIIAVRGYIWRDDGNYMSWCNMWTEIDGVALEHSVGQMAADKYQSAVYSSPAIRRFSAGEHTIEVYAKADESVAPDFEASATIEVGVIMEAESTACSEDPGSEPDPQVVRTSIITSAPQIDLPGATAVYDMTGREVQSVTDAQVDMSQLPAGTYIARLTDNRSVKVVKVD